MSHSLWAKRQAHRRREKHIKGPDEHCTPGPVGQDPQNGVPEMHFERQFQHGLPNCVQTLYQVIQPVWTPSGRGSVRSRDRTFALFLISSAISVIVPTPSNQLNTSSPAISFLSLHSLSPSLLSTRLPFASSDYISRLRTLHERHTCFSKESERAYPQTERCRVLTSARRLGELHTKATHCGAITESPSPSVVVEEASEDRHDTICPLIARLSAIRPLRIVLSFLPFKTFVVASMQCSANTPSQLVHCA
jgi:hypothetical protein